MRFIHTSGTLSLSACEEAASVVTDRRAIILAGATKALGLNNGVALLRAILENISKGIKQNGVENEAEIVF
jgi:hypothetical protein